MTIYESVVHRMRFPIMRKATRQAAMAGAIITNHVTASYIQSHTPPPETVEDDTPMGMYL